MLGEKMEVVDERREKMGVRMFDGEGVKVDGIDEVRGGVEGERVRKVRMRMLRGIWKVGDIWMECGERVEVRERRKGVKEKWEVNEVRG